MDELPKIQIGTFTRDASERLTYEIYSFPPGRFHRWRQAVQKQFGLIKWGVGIETPDEILCTLRNWRYKIGFEWDNWSGLIVVAKSRASEPLVIEIARYLERQGRALLGQ